MHNREDLFPAAGAGGSAGSTRRSESVPRLMPASVIAIARRELRDSISDWRMMLPVLILTFVVPLLIQGALMFLLGFLHENSTIIKLVPFGALLCGFLPASFSLIVALESFVGEKERNTLEALLAMPLTDRELYLGKLIAAVTSPLFSSLLAMATFMGLLVLDAPARIIQGLTPLLMVEMVLLVVCKAVVMVAGAVIVSTHTTTTRAANLLASFILVPMASLVQIEALLVIAGNLRTLLAVIAGLVVVAAMLIRAGLLAFNRESILGREHAGLSARSIRKTIRSFAREYRPAGTMPELYGDGPFSWRKLVRDDLRALLRDYRAPLGIVVLVSLVALLLGSEFAMLPLGRYLGGWLTPLDRPPAPGLLTVALLFLAALPAGVFVDLVAPLSFGIIAFLYAVFSFAHAGYVAAFALVYQGSDWRIVLIALLPVLLLELPAKALTAAIGFRTGAALLVAPKPFSIGQNLLWSLVNGMKLWLLVVVPLLLAAALVEGLITPHLINALR